MNFEIIDCHLHCGVQNVPWGWEKKRPLLTAVGIRGVGIIPPVEGVIDRRDPTFIDTPAWQACRRRAHRYLLDLREACRSAGWPAASTSTPIFLSGTTSPGKTWGRSTWPSSGTATPMSRAYQYDQPRCREFLQVVRQRRLPILLEESFNNTLLVLERLAPDLPVVIPHLGGLNGGYEPLRKAGVGDRPFTYADTSTAGLPEMEDFLGRYGSDRPTVPAATIPSANRNSNWPRSST